MLVHSDVMLEFISNSDILFMIETMKRAGLCCVGSNRCVKANNKYMPDYDSHAESNYIKLGGR